MAAFLSLSRPATVSILNWSEVVLLLFGVVLVVGLVGEYRESARFKRWIKVFEFMVIIGVAGELLADGSIFLFSARLETIAEEEISESNVKAAQAAATARGFEAAIADANARAKGAESVVAQANATAKGADARVAEAEAMAETERLARVKIEEKLAPRRLSPEQVRQVANALRPFAGVHVNLFAPTGDVEIVRIANDVLAALMGPNGAHWTVTVSTGQEFGRTVSGILVELAADADETSKSAARAFVLALQTQRLVTTGPVPPTSRGPMVGPIQFDQQAKITITVGQKL